eukprot:TRINITY_DN2035_c0_g1_i7.p2 TRINITY_DN2035_c0_g1~~TRINITY_DN2035_c0_g1_i7.p2  ORF type:complete len:114 (+),score=11.95 TRINITY_DN2035_c0_g1_i7:138-479(+)
MADGNALRVMDFCRGCCSCSSTSSQQLRVKSFSTSTIPRKANNKPRLHVYCISELHLRHQFAFSLSALLSMGPSSLAVRHLEDENTIVTKTIQVPSRFQELCCHLAHAPSQTR